MGWTVQYGQLYWWAEEFSVVKFTDGQNRIRVVQRFRFFAFEQLVQSVKERTWSRQFGYFLTFSENVRWCWDKLGDFRGNKLDTHSTKLQVVQNLLFFLAISSIDLDLFWWNLYKKIIRLEISEIDQPFDAATSQNFRSSKKRETVQWKQTTHFIILKISRYVDLN